MPALKTDFFTVAQSGPTVDGREIKKQWLKDSAETYSQGIHISKIWPEHYRYMGLGEIADVRYKEENGIGYLENRISPHDDLIYFVRQNRMTQPSIEIIENFANSGKAYQYGLGATNSPASLGVGKMPLLFNTQEEQGKTSIEQFTQRIAIDAGVSSDQVHVFASQTQWQDLEFKKERKYFDLGRFFKRDETPPKQEEALEMTKEELDASLKGFATELKDGLKKDLVKEFGLTPATPETPEKPPAKTDTPAENHSTEVTAETEVDDEKTVPLKQFNELKDNFEALEKKFNKVMNTEKTKPNSQEHGTTEKEDPWNWDED